MQRKRSRKLAEDNVFGGKKTLENPQKQKSKSEIGKPLESKNCPDQMKCRGKKQKTHRRQRVWGKRKPQKIPRSKNQNSGIGKPLESKICPLSDQMKFEGKELENSQKKVDNPYNMFGRK